MGSPTIRLRCCWPECAHEWSGAYTASDYTSCPRCHASFSFRKPIMLDPTPPAPADDASGAEAAACVAPAHDMAPRVVVEPYGTSCWQVWLHIGAASWTVGNYRRDKDATERFAEPLRHALRAALPARDDAVEEAMVPGCHEHVALWDAINAYSAACGGHPTRGGGARMDAVVRVEKALRAALRREKGGA